MFAAQNLQKNKSLDEVLCYFWPNVAMQLSAIVIRRCLSICRRLSVCLRHVYIMKKRLQLELRRIHVK